MFEARILTFKQEMHLISSLALLLVIVAVAFQGASAVRCKHRSGGEFVIQ